MQISSNNNNNSVVGINQQQLHQQQQQQQIQQQQQRDPESRQLAIYDTILTVSQAHHAHCAYTEEKTRNIVRTPIAIVRDLNIYHYHFLKRMQTNSISLIRAWFTHS